MTMILALTTPALPFPIIAADRVVARRRGDGYEAFAECQKLFRMGSGWMAGTGDGRFTSMVGHAVATTRTDCMNEPSMREGVTELARLIEKLHIRSSIIAASAVRRRVVEYCSDGTIRGAGDIQRSVLFSVPPAFVSTPLSPAFMNAVRAVRGGADAAAVLVRAIAAEFTRMTMISSGLVTASIDVGFGDSYLAGTSSELAAESTSTIEAAWTTPPASVMPMGAIEEAKAFARLVEAENQRATAAVAAAPA